MTNTRIQTGIYILALAVLAIGFLYASGTTEVHGQYAPGCHGQVAAAAPDFCSTGNVVYTQCSSSQRAVISPATVSCPGNETYTIDDAGYCAADAACETPLPTVNLSANPSSVVRSNSGSLSWSSSNATSCTSYNGTFTTGNASSGTVSISPQEATNYGITCTGPGGTVSDDVTVSVTEPTMDASCQANTSSALVGESVTWTAYAWNGTPSYSYSWLGQAISGLTGATISTSYEEIGTKNASVSVTDSSSLGAGMSVTTYENQRCTGSAVTGNITAGWVEDGGYAEDIEELANSFGRDVFGGSGSGYLDSSYQSTYDDVRANPSNYCVETKVTQQCNPNGNPAWQGCNWRFNTRIFSANGSRDTDSGDFGDYVGNPPWDQNRYYVVTKGQIASGVPRNIARACTTDVTVSLDAPTASLTANPVSVLQGNPATLTHTCTNSTSASIDQGVGAVTPTESPGATVSVTPAATTLYTLTCTGSGGTATASVTVGVTAAQPDLTVSNVSSVSAGVGQPVDLVGTVTNGGTGGTGAGFTNLFQVATDSSGSDAQTLGTHSMSALASSGSGQTSRTHTFNSPGNWYVRICADKSWAGDTNGSIAESNENNNCSGSWTLINVSEAEQGTLVCTVDPSNIPVNEFATYSATGVSGPFTWTPADGAGQQTTNEGSLTRYFSTQGNYGMQVAAWGQTANCPVVVVGTPSCGSANASITASPNRVREGQTATVSWSASGVDTSCTVTGPGVNQTIAGNSCTIPNGQATPTITEQSVYRITCDGGEDTAEVIVNLIPEFIEF